MSGTQLIEEFGEALPAPSTDGTETLTINVEWQGGHRDRVRIEHRFAATAEQQSVSEVLVNGRSMNDVMRTVARFFDMERVEASDRAFVLTFRSRDVGMERNDA